MKNVNRFVVAASLSAVLAAASLASCGDSISRQTFSAVPVGPVVLPARRPVTGAAPMSFLKTKGSSIVNDKDENVLLRGVGLGNWLLPEGYMWHFGDQGDRPRRIEKVITDLIGQQDADAFWKEYRAQYISEKDIARIADLGFNSVRPAMDAKLLLTEDDNPQFREDGFLLLDNLIAWCRKRNIYVILDMHAAPGGQTGLNIDDSIDDRPLLFMGDKKYEERLTKLWVEIARRYKDEPAVAMYDLLNEPLPKRTGAEDKYKDLLEPLYKRITAAIRQVDTKHIITLEGSNFANNLTVFGKPFDDNLVYQFHYYCRANPTEVKPMASYLTPGKALGAPLWVGETGERDPAIYWGTTEWMEAENIGWSFWPWKKMNADNGMCSVTLPKDWEIIASQTQGAQNAGRSKPTAAEAKRVLWELLANIRLENCTYFPEVGNAMFQRVPERVEAENYGRGGLNVSYFVNDTKINSKLYRKLEPVQVEAVGEGKRSDGQAIHLLEKEWTMYDFTSLDDRDYAMSVRVKRDEAPTSFRISVNGANADGSQKAAPIAIEWMTLKLNPVHLHKGVNHLKFLVTAGGISFDWVELR